MKKRELFYQNILLLLFYNIGGSVRSYLPKKSGYPWSIYRGFAILELCNGVGLIINYANLKLLLQKVDAHLPPLPPNDILSKYEFCFLYHILLFQMQY